MYQPLDQFLDKVKSERKEAVHESLIQRRKKQRLVFVLLAEVYDLSNQYDLRNHKGVDQREGIIPERNVVLLEQESGIGRKGTEEECQLTQSSLLEQPNEYPRN